MRGRDFLIMARLLVKQPYESGRRSAAGRAYYALLNEAAAALRGWGWAEPSRDRFHIAVRTQYVCASDGDLKAIGLTLEELSRLRNAADYELSVSRRFDDVEEIRGAIEDAEEAIKLLDAIERNSGRQDEVRAALPRQPGPS